jgi:hypothetical protein
MKRDQACLTSGTSRVALAQQQIDLYKQIHQVQAAKGSVKYKNDDHFL